MNGGIDSNDGKQEAVTVLKQEVVTFPSYVLKFFVLPRANSLIENGTAEEIKLKESTVLIKPGTKSEKQTRLATAGDRDTLKKRFNQSILKLYWT